ncbi:MAG: potassium channel family protein [Pirellulales bacterium]|nr:potassium channel family protein [Pirellulales bacterium]
MALAGSLIARFDRIPLEDAIYFAFIAAFTVGFGDVTPRTRIARCITVFLALIGVILTGISVAVAVRALDLALMLAAG